MANTKVTKDEMVNEMNEWVTCPVCFDVPRVAPILQCRNGHIVCSSCRERLQSCPTCRSALTNVRNLFAEHYVENFALHHCQINEEECQARLRLTEIQHHEQCLCEFRLVACPGRKCRKRKFQVKWNKLSHHVITADCLELVRVRGKVTGSIDVSKYTRKFQQTNGGFGADICLDFDGDLFFVEAGFFNWSFLIWVSILGTAEDAEKYAAEITIFNNASSKKFHGSVTWVTNDINAIRMNSNLFLSPKELAEYQDSQGCIHFTLRLTAQMQQPPKGLNLK